MFTEEVRLLGGLQTKRWESGNMSGVGLNNDPPNTSQRGIQQLKNLK